MDIIEDVFSVREKWNSASWRGRGLILFILIFAIILFIFRTITEADNAYSVILKWNIIERISILLGSKIMNLSYFDASLFLLVVFMVLLVFSFGFAYIFEKEQTKLSEERTKAANYKKLVLNEFEELIKFMNGETKFVTSERKIINNQESFDNLIEGLFLTNQSNEDVKDKLGQVCRKLREN